MKKNLFCMLIALVMLFSTAMAETVYVTISNGQGEIVLAMEEIEAMDVDSDGIVSICDALYCAHDSAYEGGADAGFHAEATEFGISLYRLWGEENGGSYGYCMNNASANSLLDPVKNGDSIYAYVFTDLAGWSDTYCYFDVSAADCAAGESIELTLTMQSYDADWNTVLLNVEGAAITVNGEETGVLTDAAGKAVIQLDAAGKYLISARSDTMTLVPPVCIATVK